MFIKLIHQYNEAQIWAQDFWYSVSRGHEREIFYAYDDLAKMEFSEQLFSIFQLAIEFLGQVTQYPF